MTNVSVGVNIVGVGVFPPEDQSVMEKSLYIDAVLLTKLKKGKKLFGCITHSAINMNKNLKKKPLNKVINYAQLK